MKVARKKNKGRLNQREKPTGKRKRIVQLEEKEYEKEDDVSDSSSSSDEETRCKKRKKKRLKRLILNVKMIYKVPLKKKKKLRITNKF